MLDLALRLVKILEISCVLNTIRPQKSVFGLCERSRCAVRYPLLPDNFQKRLRTCAHDVCRIQYKSCI